MIEHAERRNHRYVAAGGFVVSAVVTGIAAGKSIATVIAAPQ